VESLTALAEHADGTLEIIDWAEHMPVPSKATPAREAVEA
jgi:hypothetical protein